MRFASLDEWLTWQEGLHPRAIDLGLERVRKVAAQLGLLTPDPPVITVAGTNGKGSCVALLEAILQAEGYRVGAFTSPHLVRYTERIRVAGAEVTAASLVDAFERIDQARGDTSLTFFEFNTLAGLLVFREAGLDALILEVGLGGRLDAVNLIDADVVLLTSIGLDHCDWLGDTLEAIGAEKAGVFRPDRPAVFGSGAIPRSVRDEAAKLGTPLLEPGVDYSFTRGPSGWSWRSRAQSLANLPMPALSGAHQVDNAAAVLAVLEQIRERLPVSRTAIESGLRSVAVPGRFQRFQGPPEWILDVAHNPAAAERLAATLAETPAQGRTWAIVGILRDKDAPTIVSTLRESVDRWIAVDLPGARGSTSAQLRDRVGASQDANWTTAASVELACEYALQNADRPDRVVVMGSFHTVGPALAWLMHRAAA